MKKRFKVLYFYAYWDKNYELKDLFYEECKKRNIFFDCVDVETEEGLGVSCKYNVKLCPYVIVFDNGKEIKRGIANEIFEQGILD